MDAELKTSFRINESLELRVFTEADVQPLYDLAAGNRDRLQRFMDWMTDDYSVASTQAFVEAATTAIAERRSLPLGIFLEGRVIGSAGFVRFDWVDRNTEIGYWIDRGEEGKGIVSAACRVLIEYSLAELELNRIEIRCSVDNARSASIPERLGFTREGILRKATFRDGRFHDFAVYGLLADDKRLW